MRGLRDDLDTDIEAIVDALIPRLARASTFDDIMLFAHEALATETPTRRPNVANTGVLLGEIGYISPRDLGSAYRDLQREEQSLVVLPPSERSKPDLTAHMLEGLSPAALRALRRRLAAAHHPDLLSGPAKIVADNRMREINEMIDIALGATAERENS